MTRATATAENQSETDPTNSVEPQQNHENQGNSDNLENIEPPILSDINGNNERNLNKLTYEEYIKCNGKMKSWTPNVQEVIGDLFEIDENVHLAHCVSKNLRMSRGVALKFRRKFGKLDELQLQQKQVTEIAYLKQESRFII